MSRNNFWGELVKTVRQEMGLSQRALAEGAKVSRNVIRNIEEGRSPGFIDTVEDLLAYMGYELDAMDKWTPEERAEKIQQFAEAKGRPRRKYTPPKLERLLAIRFDY